LTLLAGEIGSESGAAFMALVPQADPSEPFQVPVRNSFAAQTNLISKVAKPSLHRPLLGLLVWSALAIYFASEAALRQLPGRVPGQMSWSDALLINFTFYLIWGALSPLVLWLSRRYPIRGEARWRHVALHVGIGIAFAAAHLLLTELPFELFRRIRGSEVPFGAALWFSFRNNFHVNILTYWAIVAVRHLRDYDQGLREKELVASRLREELARAELGALRMQLHPHFLFNALHSISALVHTDPMRADAMLVRLSDLLRRSLEKRSLSEIPLGQELDFVRGYLELAEMRHGERLRAEMHVPSSLLTALVPTFVLQPLVENAVVHGVEPSADPCRIVVRARPVRDRLVLEVENDLSPQAGDSRRRGGGIGLASVRSRLEQLYSGIGRVELDVDPGVRAVARVVLPFREVVVGSVPPRSVPLEIPA
jgi:two-component system, LytTR family, sensor kinase